MQSTMTRNAYKETGDPARLPAQLILCDGNKGSEILYGEEKNILYLADYRSQGMQNKNISYRHTKPRETTKIGPLSFVLFESPFSSVSTVFLWPPLSSLSDMTEYFFSELHFNPFLVQKLSSFLYMRKPRVGIWYIFNCVVTY
jgi:hypothetical protein